MTMGQAADEAGFDREKEQISSSTKRLMQYGAEEMDQDARDMAHDAVARIKSHEELCTERWNQARAATGRVEVALAVLQKAMDDRIGKMPAALIAGLTGMVGWLAARAFPLH